MVLAPNLTTSLGTKDVKSLGQRISSAAVSTGNRAGQAVISDLFGMAIGATARAFTG